MHLGDSVTWDVPGGAPLGHREETRLSGEGGGLQYRRLLLGLFLVRGGFHVISVQGCPCAAAQAHALRAGRRPAQCALGCALQGARCWSVPLTSAPHSLFPFTRGTDHSLLVSVLGAGLPSSTYTSLLLLGRPVCSLRLHVCRRIQRAGWQDLLLDTTNAAEFRV